MKKLLFAMAVGAALAWFFDPDNGSRRRTQVQRKMQQSGVSSGSGSTSPAPLASTPPVASTNHTPAAVATIP